MAKEKKGSSLSWLLLALGFAAGVGAALFFFFYESGFVTGAELAVDGGMAAGL